MNDEAQVWLVEPHAEGNRGNQCLHIVGPQAILELVLDVMVEPCVIRGNVEALPREPVADALGVGDRQGIDDAGSRETFEVLSEPCQRSA